jgi:hypothetical protein
MLPLPCDVGQHRVNIGMAIPWSMTEFTYQAIQHAIADPDQNLSLKEEDELFPEPIWAQNSSNSQDCLDTFLPSDEAIIEVMTSAENHWEDMHHRSYFLLDISRMEKREFKLDVSRRVDQTVNPLVGHGVYTKGNMENI